MLASDVSLIIFLHLPGLFNTIDEGGDERKGEHRQRQREEGER
jgi:hypothetical protein